MEKLQLKNKFNIYQIEHRVAFTVIDDVTTRIAKWIMDQIIIYIKYEMQFMWYKKKEIIITNEMIKHYLDYVINDKDLFHYIVTNLNINKDAYPFYENIDIIISSILKLFHEETDLDAERIYHTEHGHNCSMQIIDGIKISWEDN